MSENGDAGIRILDAREADPSQLLALYAEAFGPGMSRFLLEHGDWMHRGPGGRFVATVDGVLAACRAIIPTRCALGGEELPAVWGVNTYVLPRFRRRGLQGLLDAPLLGAADLRMSFPGVLMAQIYARQGCGIREDLWEWHLPLSPVSYWREIQASARAVVRQTPAVARAVALQTQVGHHGPRRTKMAEQLDVAVLEDIYRRHVDPGCATTLRDSAFLRWRYLEAPCRSELVVFVTGLDDRLTHYAIVRRATSPAGPARVLDLFGDFHDEEGLTDLLRAIVRDASVRRLGYVAILVSLPQLVPSVRGCGFFAAKPYRFRWLAEDPELHARLSRARLCWTLGDSDNDLQAGTLS